MPGGHGMSRGPPKVARNNITALFRPKKKGSPVGEPSGGGRRTGQRALAANGMRIP